MPLYEYECARCGPFTELRSMSESGRGAKCPDCAGRAGRILSIPALRRPGRPSNRRKAQREPAVMQRPERAEPPPPPKPHAGHGRPWMLGH